MNEDKKWMNLQQPPYPPYDQRSGCFWQAGTDHGVGKAQPVGKESISQTYGVPRGCSSKKIGR